MIDRSIGYKNINEIMNRKETNIIQQLLESPERFDVILEHGDLSNDKPKEINYCP